jgi:hypothetical protein
MKEMQVLTGIVYTVDHDHAISGFILEYSRYAYARLEKNVSKKTI